MVNRLQIVYNSVILLLLIIILVYVYNINKNTSRREILFLEGVIPLRLQDSNTYSSIYAYNNEFNPKGYKSGSFIVKLQEVTSSNKAFFRVQDENNVIIGKEVPVSSERSYHIPFKSSKKHNTLNLLARGKSENIEVVRLDIEFD